MKNQENTQQREAGNMDGNISGLEVCAKYFWKLEWSDMAVEVVRNTLSRVPPAL